VAGDELFERFGLSWDCIRFEKPDPQKREPLRMPWRMVHLSSTNRELLAGERQEPIDRHLQQSVVHPEDDRRGKDQQVARCDLRQELRHLIVQDATTAATAAAAREAGAYVRVRQGKDTEIAGAILENEFDSGRHIGIAPNS
jgi:hypothetical protein